MPIQAVDLKKVDERSFSRRCVGCIILTQEGKILLQQRDDDCYTYPGCLATFGGGIDSGERPMQSLVRELREELGAQVRASDVVNLGAITENFSNIVKEGLILQSSFAFSREIFLAFL